MKTNQLILAAAALVVLASCTKSNVDPVNTAKTEGDEIGFAAVAQKATKADNAIITGNTYGEDNHFNVWGWQSAKDGIDGDNIAFSDISDNALSNFMTGLKIEWTKGRDTENHGFAWRNAANYYYWPFTGKISFLAIHPFTVEPTTVKWDAGNKKPKATIDDYTIASGNKTTDLMFATNEGTRASNAETPVTMLFKHALSQIQFRVRTNDDYTADEVEFKVNSVTLNNIDLSGDLAYANNTFTWSDNDTQEENWAYYATPQVVTYAATDAAAALYGAANVMIPQPAYIHADAVGEPGDPGYVAEVPGTKITISYTMKQKTNAAITGTVTVAAPWTKVKERNTDYDPAAAIAAWEPGKKYNYTLCFKLNEINFDPKVTNWVEVEMSTINIFD